MVFYLVPREVITSARGRINGFFNKFEQEAKSETRTRVFVQENEGICFYGILSGAIPNLIVSHIMVLGKFSKNRRGYYLDSASEIAQIHSLNSAYLIGISTSPDKSCKDIEAAVSILEETIKYTEMPVGYVTSD